MKMDEPQESQNKVGVTFRRIPFETEVDIYPKMNPLVESKGERSGDSGDMSPLTSVQTEERLKEAVQHRAVPNCDDEFLAIPLKRIDSGPHQHHIQDPKPQAKTQVQSTENNNMVHCALLDEIDNCPGPRKETKGKTSKKDNTLTRMLKGFKVDKSNQDESEDKLGAHVTISKIFHRINPVGKASRDNFSRVFHRIGDALQKKSEGEDFSERSERTADRGVYDSQPETSKFGQGELSGRCPKIGEKMFRCRPSNTDAHKTEG